VSLFLEEVLEALNKVLKIGVSSYQRCDPLGQLRGDGLAVAGVVPRINQDYYAVVVDVANDAADGLVCHADRFLFIPLLAPRFSFLIQIVHF
jgi:hypothetical protein